MSYKNLVIQILEKAKHPLSINKIFENLSLESTYTKEMEEIKASLATAIYRDVKKGKLSKLIKTGRGTFGLRLWIYPDEIQPTLENTNRKENKPGIYKWEQKGKSIIAYYREHDPYRHYCPTSHFKTICNQLLQHLIENEDISSKVVIELLEGQQFPDSHVFRKTQEVYKINMVINILSFEGVITKCTSTLNSYSLLETIDTFSTWLLNIH